MNAWLLFFRFSLRIKGKKASRQFIDELRKKTIQKLKHSSIKSVDFLLPLQLSEYVRDDFTVFNCWKSLASLHLKQLNQECFLCVINGNNAAIGCCDSTKSARHCHSISTLAPHSLLFYLWKHFNNRHFPYMQRQ